MKEAVYPQRILSLDVFRGIVLIAMIIVNSSGTHSYSFLKHCVWNGCHFADLIFPFFVVMLGISSVLALNTLQLQGYSHYQLMQTVLKRTAQLFLLGLLLNAFPHHFMGDFSTLRFPGVLQRLAICYFFSACFCLTTGPKTQAIFCFSLLLGYWFLMHFWENFGLPGSPFTPTNNAFGLLDQHLLTPSHMYTPHFDPEGLISTIPAIASALLGNLLGYCLISKQSQQDKAKKMLLAGGILALLGWLWGVYLPFNKSLWTSSFVLWTGGLSFIFYSLCFFVVDIKRWNVQWFKSLAIFGQYTLSVYILHIVFLKIQALVIFPTENAQTLNLKMYLIQAFFGQFSAQNAALSYALTYAFFWFVIIQITKQWKTKKSFIAY